MTAGSLPLESTRLLTVEQVAKMIAVSKRTIWRMVSGKQIIQPIRIRGNTRFRQDELQDWINAGCPPMINEKLENSS